MHIRITTRLLCVSGALALATTAAADTFSVNLGTKTLGQLTYRQAGAEETLVSRLDNTPLGVFNGVFNGTSRGKGNAHAFTGISKSSRKNRRAEVQMAGGRAVSTKVTPEEEITDLSDIQNVPANVVDPVQGFGHLTTATGGCPSAIRMYDGRRVIALTPTGQGNDGQGLVCDVDYSVIAGPGHLSPLLVKSARMQLTYDQSGGAQRLVRIRLRSGIFSVTLDRTG
mgnify:CR=1 FL=1